MEILEKKEINSVEETRMTQEYIDFLEETYGDGVKREAGFKYAAGVDSGSKSTKVVIMRSDGLIVGKGITETGISSLAATNKALSEALSEAGIGKEDLSGIVSIGYGKKTVGPEGEITEDMCRAAGEKFVSTLKDPAGEPIDADGLSDSFGVLGAALYALTGTMNK